MVVEEELVTFQRGCGQTEAFKYLKYLKKIEKKKEKGNVHTDGIPKDSWDSLQLRSPAVYPKKSSLVK